MNEKTLQPIKKIIANNPVCQKVEEEIQKRQIKPISFNELITKKFLEPEWVVEKLIPQGGITIISGAPASYKTWLLLDMAKDIAKGEKFLGKFQTQKNKVLIIDEENGAQILNRRFKQLTQKQNLDISFLTFTNFQLRDFNYSINFLKKEKIDVVILDSLIRVGGIKDENSSAEMAKIFNYLKIAKKEGITIIITHHNRKQGKFKIISGEEMRGSSEVLAFVDCAFSIQKKGEDIIKINQTKLRTDKEINPFLIEIKEENKLLNFNFLNFVEKNKSKIEEAKKQIIQILENGKTLRTEIFKTIKDEKQVEIGDNSIKNALKQLENEKKIKRTQEQGRSVSFELMG